MPLNLCTYRQSTKMKEIEIRMNNQEAMYENLFIIRNLQTLRTL